ncbi:KR domain-containing protein [Nocardia elegans]|nr:KR domain-containing protein [Nocardia elegans]
MNAARAAGGVQLVIDRNRPDIDVDWEQADLADSAAAEEAKCARAGGRIDGVFTAAGIDACGPLEKVGAAAWERVVRVNLLGTAA